MSIEDIILALEEQCRSECQAIFQEAHRQAEGIVRQAEVEAEEIRRSKREKVISAAESEAAAMLYSARLRAKNLAVEVKESVLEDVFKKAREEAGRMRESGDYPRIFTALLEEALISIGEGGVLHVDPRDCVVAERALQATGKAESMTIEEDLSCLGGLVVSDKEGRINIVNTFDERLKRARERLKLEVTRILFGGGEKAAAAG